MSTEGIRGLNRVARIGPEQYNGTAALRAALEKTGFPPRALEHLLIQQGIVLNGDPVFALHAGTDYLYCNAADDAEAQALFQQYLGKR